MPFFWTSGRKCNFDGCNKPEFFPKLINGWFWSANQVRRKFFSDCLFDKILCHFYQVWQNAELFLIRADAQYRRLIPSNWLSETLKKMKILNELFVEQV